MKTASTAIVPRARRKPACVLVPVLVTIMIPVPCADAYQDGDEGKSFARETIQELPLTLGGVPVKVLPA